MRNFRSLFIVLFCLLFLFFSSISVANSVKEISASDLHEIMTENKGKVVIVNFWSTKCEGCVKEISEFIKLRERFSSDEVEIIGVSFDLNGSEILSEFIQENGINYSIYCAVDSYDIINEYEIISIPLTVIYDKSGNEVYIAKGVASEETFAEEIDKLLSK